MSAEAVMWVLLLLLTVTTTALALTVLRVLRLIDTEREARGQADSERDGWMKYAVDLEPYAQHSLADRWLQSPAEGHDWNEGTGMHAVRGDAT